MSSQKPEFIESLPEELANLETALASLGPVPVRLDRDQLMFLAGVASSKAQPHTANARLWATATGLAALVATIFASLYAVELNRPVQTVREVVYVEREAPAPVVAELVVTNTESAVEETQATAKNQPAYADRSPAEGPLRRKPSFMFFGQWPLAVGSTNNYLAMRQLVFEKGIDALPQRTYDDGDDDDFNTDETDPPVYTSHELLKEYLPAAETKVSTEADGTWFHNLFQEPTTTEMRETI